MLGILITTTLVTQGFTPDIAQIVAKDVITKLQELRGGSQIYIRSNRKGREKRILHDWKNSGGGGRNIANVAARHNVTVSTVYNVIKRSKNRRKSKLPSGFGSDDWVI